jgi:hypothetical protein
VQAENIHHFAPSKDIFACVPTPSIPFSIHAPSLSNIHNAIMSRNFRCLNPKINNDIIYSLNRHCSVFLKGIKKCNGSDKIDMEKFLQSRKWSSYKIAKFKNCNVDIMPPLYTTNLFPKEERVYKTDLKAPRLINDPATCFKKKYIQSVYSATQKIKKQLVYGSDFNKISDHINLIWTSGMNRDKNGLQFTQIDNFFKEINEDYKIVSADYSKFESTQIPEIMLNLRSIYRNIASDEVRSDLQEICSYITGPKVAYANKEGYVNKYKFNATRTSGDITTTIGNTLLGMAIADWIFRDVKLEDKKLIFLMQSGDDGQFVLPKRFLYHFEKGIKELFEIGMKLDAIIIDKPENSDYNSSILLNCYDETLHIERHHLCAKLGRLLGRVGYTVCRYDDTQFKALQYQKAMALINELQLFPGIQDFYIRYLELYKKYSSVKIQLKYKELTSVNKISPTLNTVHQICNRYDISTYEYYLLNSTFKNFDVNEVFLENNLNYSYISDIMKKIYKKDLVDYEDEDVERFSLYFEKDFIDRYVKYYH